MRKPLLILFTGLLICLHGIAQRSTDINEPKKVFVRFNPLGLVNIFDENLSFGAEYRFQNRWSAALDASWIFYSYDFNEKNTNSSGYIFRPALRYYVGRRLRMFYEAELHYKTVTHHIEDWLGRDCVNNIPTYEEFTKFRYRKINYGLHLKTGFIFPLRRDSRFFLEIYGGLGVHHREVKIVGQPNCCWINHNRFTTITDDREQSVYVAVPMGFRFLYRVN